MRNEIYLNLVQMDPPQWLDLKQDQGHPTARLGCCISLAMYEVHSGMAILITPGSLRIITRCWTLIEPCHRKGLVAVKASSDPSYDFVQMFIEMSLTSTGPRHHVLSRDSMVEITKNTANCNSLSLFIKRVYQWILCCFKYFTVYYNPLPSG